MGRSHVHDQPRVATAYRVKVVANAHLGRLDEARGELGLLLAIDSHFTIATVRAFAESFAPEFVELYIGGLRLAGQPEQ